MSAADEHTHSEALELVDTIHDRDLTDVRHHQHDVAMRAIRRAIKEARGYDWGPCCVGSMLFVMRAVKATRPS